MEQSQTDLELVMRVQAGDKKSFDLLVLKYQHRVVSLVHRYVRDDDLAFDVAQETFIKAYRGLKNFRGESAFYTWLYRIAINTAKNYLVSEGRRAPSVDIDADEAEQYEGESALKEYGTPEHELLREEIELAVSTAIEALPEDLKTAILLREIEGMSYDEIALVMDCPIGTVRSRIFRAREAIDKVLKPLLED
ncbi:MAG: RNA polymerase sigma factor RpoE [Thiofilum sp.]|uniref:RNA polymerase sigma factor RpoE n=1 Tax=Thiofilum sp. TaxID=2212733 RepID=UPI0025FF5C4F|nr:RNA polymerase sigma factor RpoE [Thiofilum sp.]MBK8455235.1 RNA polymerase sigma factor RpoE [Thiofilum sp.]